MTKWLLNAIGAFFCGGVVYAVLTWLFHMRKAQAQRVWLYVSIAIFVLEILWDLVGRLGPGAGRGYGQRTKRG